MIERCFSCFVVGALALSAACNPPRSSRLDADSGAPDASDGQAPEDAGRLDGAAGDAGPQDAAGPLDAGDAAEDWQCTAEHLVDDGCQPLPDSSELGLCDGFDNDCDGTVDEGCPCAAGEVQACFRGPPGRAGVGACRPGRQTCLSSLEFAFFGPCEGDQQVTAEVCDNLDNDCNGCVDDLPGCAPILDCPGPSDPRVPAAKPFQTYGLDAKLFYGRHDVKSYRWTVEGSPCDELFMQIPGSTATPQNGQLSYVIQGRHSAQASVRFNLSGTYLVTLDMVLDSGEQIGCSFPVKVGGPGLRVELCWDKTGPTSAQNPIDLDLHLARKGSTTSFGGASDCYYLTCFPQPGVALGIWQHPNTPDVSACLTGTSDDFIHEQRGHCINPRIDIDNQDETEAYVAENINLDNPRAGEVFQVAVNHTSPLPVRTQALVNIYCGGNLRGSFSLDPTSAAFSDSVSSDEYWRVAEIAVDVDGAGQTRDCALTPLFADDVGAPDLRDGDLTVSWSEL